MKTACVFTVVLCCATLPFSAPAARAQSYQIDCAILLCLSGGWPASEPCARAKAEFIRRITPWPVEPPLQIWRCPMSAAYTVDPETLTTDQIYEILLDLGDAAPRQSLPVDPDWTPEPAVLRQSGGTAARLSGDVLLHLSQGSPSADIDISGPAFDFVRSIRVFDITWREYVRENHGGDKTCWSHGRIQLGTYGQQGEFSWHGVGPEVAEDAVWLGFTTYADDPCDHAGFFRGVGVEWTDTQGNHGFEVVRY